MAHCPRLERSGNVNNVPAFLFSQGQFLYWLRLLSASEPSVTSANSMGKVLERLEEGCSCRKPGREDGKVIHCSIGLATRRNRHLAYIGERARGRKAWKNTSKKELLYSSLNW